MPPKLWKHAGQPDELSSRRPATQSAAKRLKAHPHFIHRSVGSHDADTYCLICAFRMKINLLTDPSISTDLARSTTLSAAKPREPLRGNCGRA